MTRPLSIRTEEKIMELEAKVGVAKSDAPEYIKLSQAQWCYVLAVVDSPMLLENKTTLADDLGLHRGTLYSYDGSPHVSRAILRLDNTVYSTRSTKVLRKAYEMAEAGDRHMIKLILDRYRPVDASVEMAEEQPRLDWDTTLAQPKTPKSPDTQGNIPAPHTPDQRPN